MHILIMFENTLRNTYMNWCLRVFPESCDVNFTMYADWPIHDVGFSSQEMLKILGTRTGIYRLITHLLAEISLFLFKL